MRPVYLCVSRSPVSLLIHYRHLILCYDPLDVKRHNRHQGECDITVHSKNTLQTLGYDCDLHFSACGCPVHVAISSCLRILVILCITVGNNSALSHWVTWVFVWISVEILSFCFLMQQTIKWFCFYLHCKMNYTWGVCVGVYYVLVSLPLGFSVALNTACVCTQTHKRLLRCQSPRRLSSLLCLIITNAQSDS